MKTLFNLLFCLFSLVFLINTSAFAERTCTKTVVTSDGTRTTTIQCSISRTENPDIVRNPRELNNKVDRLMDKTAAAMEKFKNQTANQASVSSNQNQKNADVWEKEQNLIASVREKAEAQKAKLSTK